MRLICTLLALLAAFPATASAAGWTKQATVNPPQSQLAALTGVACPAANACVAVGIVATAGAKDPAALSESFDGSAWTLQPVPGALQELGRVSCAAAAFCVAIGAGADELPVAERWDGSAWTPLGTFGRKGDELGGVSCPSTTSCFAAASRKTGGVAAHWDGAGWQEQALPHAVGALLAVGCSAPDACTAVGLARKRPHRPLVLRFDGARWALQRDALPQADLLTGVACAQPAACLAIGSAKAAHDADFGPPIAERWDGRRWQPATTGLPHDAVLNDVDCRAPDQCTAVGQSSDSSQPLALRWDGGRWTRIVTPRVARVPKSSFVGAFLGALFPSFTAVSCVTNGPCVAVGGRKSGAAVGTLAEAG